MIEASLACCIVFPLLCLGSHLKRIEDLEDRIKQLEDKTK